MPDCLIALGSNVGDREALVARAIQRLAHLPQTTLRAVSHPYQTTPIGGPPDQGGFLNAAVRIETELSPHALWQQLVAIEDELGRARGQRWGPRTIDLDLLTYGDQRGGDPQLTLPHPRLAVRRFVLEPAAEIAPEIVHPTIGWSLERLRRHAREAPPYLALVGVPGVGKTRLARDLALAVAGARVIELPQSGPAAAADSSRPPVAREIEFLRRRAAALAAAFPRAPDDAAAPAGRAADQPGGAQWQISDFWFDQSLAYARARLPAGQWPEVEAAWRLWGKELVRPKLSVWIAPSRRGPAAGEPVERIVERELAAQFQRTAEGPRLELEAGDPELVAEVAAALVALETD